MYQPEEALAAYEIPTASETATPAAPPIHGCPDEPGRECMIRYLYARMKNHAVKCAHCGIIAARISNFYKAKSRAVAAKPKLPKISDDRRREVSLANLAKGRDKLLEKQAETRRIKAELREKERVQREAERAERREASRVKYNEKRYALRRESRVASAHEEAMALLDLARQAKKVHHASRASCSFWNGALPKVWSASVCAILPRGLTPYTGQYQSAPW